MRDTKLYIVVPCYNEEEVIEDSASKLLTKMNELIKNEIIGQGSKVIFVNDGSRDKTEEKLHHLCEKNSEFGVINFVKNFGHQSAILAGMLFSTEYADAVITIDADLQQDIDAIERFVQAYDKGADVVYGVRNNRDTDGIFKRVSATVFYRLMHLLGANVLANSADYRLLSQRAVKALAEYGETSLFLRGLIPFMGFSSDIVYFDVKNREKGTSKYTFSKMLNLAIDGITSFSNRPLHMISGLGGLMILFSIGMIVYSLIVYFKGGAVAGYTTTVVSIWLVGGLLMFSLGVIGEYVGKIYIETKKRPRYMIESCIFKNDDLQKGEE